MDDSDLDDLTGPQSRRMFLARSSVLTLAVPGVGAALAACSQGGSANRNDTAHPSGASEVASGQAGRAPHNSDSRLDSAVLKGEHAPTSATGSAAQVSPNVAFHREAPVRIDDETVVAAWTFEGDVPGPIVHTRVGGRHQRCDGGGGHGALRASTRFPDKTRHHRRIRREMPALELPSIPFN